MAAAAAADLLGDAGDLEADQVADDLAGVIAGADPGAAAGQHHPGAAVDGRGDGVPYLRRVVGDDAAFGGQPVPLQQVGRDRAAAVVVGTAEHLVGDHDHRRPQPGPARGRLGQLALDGGQGVLAGHDHDFFGAPGRA